MSLGEALATLKANLQPLAGPYGNIQINGVDVQGKLAPRLIEAHIQPLFLASNADELAESFATVQRNLINLKVFKDVIISINPEKVVSIQLVPVKKYSLGVGSNFNQYEGSGYIRGSVLNHTGWGEQITLDISSGTRTKSSHMVRALLPIPFSRMVDWKAEFLGYSSQKTMEWVGSRASIFGLSFRMNKDNGSSYGCDAVLRDFKSERLSVSPLLQQFAGESFKLSFFYALKYDNRKFMEGFFPPPGFGRALDLRGEVAVNPSSDPFAKWSATYQSSFSIWKRITASLNSQAGIIMPILGGKRTHILDRFNLGGPLDVRSFRFNHLGPHDSHRNATGGEVLFASGLSVYSPINDSPSLRVHNFLNAGYLGALNSSSLSEILRPSISAGTGLCYSNGQARFELNVGMPLIARENEWLQKGLQFGVGLEFL